MDYCLYFSFLITPIIVVVYYYCTRNFNYWKDRGVPYKKPTFFFGNIIEMFNRHNWAGRSIAKLIENITEPYIGLFAFNNPFLLVKDVEIINNILVRDFRHFTDRSFYYDEEVEPIWCNSLFVIKQPNWKVIRTKLSPSFSSIKLKAMFQHMRDCGENLSNYVDTLREKRNVDILKIADMYTLDTIMACAFGVNSNSFEHINNAYNILGKKLIRETTFNIPNPVWYVFAPHFVKLFRMPFIEPEARKFFSNLFHRVIKERQASKIKNLDLIDILIDLKDWAVPSTQFKLSENRLLAHAISYFAAGHETSSTMAFTIHELCLNTEIQNRLREEILNVIERYNGSVTYEGIQEMKYLDMVLSETLRKYPDAPFLHRKCTEDYLISKTGLCLKKGTSVIMSHVALHWDPKYFPNPEKFDPERFNKDNETKIPFSAYLPFGDGPRHCIGKRFGLLTIKLGIVEIIRNYKVSRDSLTEEGVIFSNTYLLKPKNGLHVRFERL